MDRWAVYTLCEVLAGFHKISNNERKVRLTMTAKSVFVRSTLHAIRLKNPSRGNSSRLCVRLIAGLGLQSCEVLM